MDNDLLDGMNLFDDEPQHEPFTSRLGLFHLHFQLVQVDPECVWRVMMWLKAIVIDARCIPGEYIVQYMAYSPRFEEWHAPASVPVYDIRVMRTAEETETITLVRREV